MQRERGRERERERERAREGQMYIYIYTYMHTHGYSMLAIICRSFVRGNGFPTRQDFFMDTRSPLEK